MATRKSIEERITALEFEVEKLKDRVNERLGEPKSWVESVAGTFANDPAFHEAMRLGRISRVSRPQATAQGGAEGPQDSQAAVSPTSVTPPELSLVRTWSLRRDRSPTSHDAGYILAPLRG